MNVKFIDTSVMLNLLEVPDKCGDKEIVKEQWRKSLEANDVLILPVATIIETGNHIAHIKDGHKRRSIAEKFGKFLKKTAEEEAPWSLYGTAMDKEILMYLAQNIGEYATRQIGIGDMSIIYSFEQYKNEVPAIGTIMIWSTDAHLQGYRVDNMYLTRRRDK